MKKSILIVVALAATPARAEPTRELRVSGPNEIFQGDPESVSLTARGYVLPGPQVRPVAQVGTAVTKMVATPRGFVLGTTEGTVHRVDSNGNLSKPLVPDPKGGVVTALSHGGAGTFAAVTPGGQIYRVQDDGLQPVSKLQVGYVWDLAQRDRELYAVTGKPAQLLRIRPGREPEVMFEADEQHLRTLAVDQDRLVFASGSNGVVYASEAGKVRALYDSKLSEATDLRIEPEGIVVSFVDPKKRAKLKSFKSVGRIGEEDDDGPFKGSEVVQIDRDGRVEVLWRSQSEGALDLLRVDDELWLATAGSRSNRGRVYGIDLESGRLRVLTRLDGPMVTALAHRKQMQLAAVAPAGSLVRLGPEPMDVAVYRSTEQDFQRVGRVGRLWFDAELPGSTRIELRFRTGNTENADGAWSEWSQPVGDPGGAPVTVSQGRYGQFEARLYTSGTDRPVLRSMHASVVRLNDPPRILDVFTLAPGVHMEGLPESQDQDKTLTLSQSVLNKLRTVEDEDGQTRVRQTKQEGALTVAWHAADTNGDELTFDLDMERLEDGAVTELKRDLRLPFHSFDSRAFPDGRYLFRVTVRDRPSNRPADALSSMRVSPPILIDNTRPELGPVSVQRVGRDRIRVQVQATDRHSPLAHAEISVDGGPWMLMPAADGIVDSRQEQLQLELKLPPRSVVISVRVRDDAQNETTRSTTFAPRGGSAP